MGIKLRLLADLIESTFDYSSIAFAMKEDVWQEYVCTSLCFSVKEVKVYSVETKLTVNLSTCLCMSDSSESRSKARLCLH